MTYIEADTGGAYTVGRRVHAQGGPIRSAMAALLVSYDQTAADVSDETLAEALYGYRDRYQREHLQVAHEAETLGINTVLGAIGLDDAQHDSAAVQRSSLIQTESVLTQLVDPLTS